MTSSDKVHCWSQKDATIAWAAIKLEEAMRDINEPVDRLQEILVRRALTLAENDDLKAVLGTRDKKERSAIQNHRQRQRRAEERYHSHHGPYPPLHSEFDYYERYPACQSRDGDHKAPNDRYGSSRPAPMTCDEFQDLVDSILGYPSGYFISSPIEYPEENPSDDPTEHNAEGTTEDTTEVTMEDATDDTTESPTARNAKDAAEGTTNDH